VRVPRDGLSGGVPLRRSFSRRVAPAACAQRHGSGRRDAKLGDLGKLAQATMLDAGAKLGATLR
jgi:hypothetical protein